MNDNEEHDLSVKEHLEYTEKRIICEINRIEVYLGGIWAKIQDINEQLEEKSMNDNEEQEPTAEQALLSEIEIDIRSINTLVFRYSTLFDRELKLINKKLDHIRFGITLAFVMLFFFALVILKIQL